MKIISASAKEKKFWILAWILDLDLDVDLSAQVIFPCASKPKSNVEWNKAHAST